MRFRFLFPLIILAAACDPGWRYRVSSKPPQNPATSSIPIRLELVQAIVFSLGLHATVNVVNATTATIALESPVMMIRDASARTLPAQRIRGCSPMDGGPFRLAPSESCPLEADFRVDPGSWRANPRLRTLS